MNTPGNNIAVACMFTAANSRSPNARLNKGVGIILVPSMRKNYANNRWALRACAAHVGTSSKA